MYFSKAYKIPYIIIHMISNIYIVSVVTTYNIYISFIIQYFERYTLHKISFHIFNKHFLLFYNNYKKDSDINYTRHYL